MSDRDLEQPSGREPPSRRARWRWHRAQVHERRRRARERREVLLALDTADEPNRWARTGDRLSRTPPLLILLIGLFGDLIGTTALGVAYTLEHQQTKRIEAGRAADHAIYCDFFGDAGSIRIVLPAGITAPATVRAFDKIFTDAAKVHGQLHCGPLPPAQIIRPTTRPTTPPPTGR